jgi:hypothetical protein
VNSLFYWIADKLRPWRDDGLSEELQFPELPFLPYRREEMLRLAKLTVTEKIPFGIFQFLGIGLAARAARAWRPRELFLMEDLSLAFQLIEGQRHRGMIVEPHHIDRFVDILHRYYVYLGEPRTSADIRDAVNRYIDKSSSRDAELASIVSRPVPFDHPLLDRLHEIDSELAERFPNKNNYPGLSELGLIFSDPIDSSRYDWCTPHNCRTFAHTGGDGIHFSFLIVDGAITDQSPVVVTDPSACGESAILGETLREFMCLGVYQGYGAISEVGGGLDVLLAKYLNPPDPGSSCPDERMRKMLEFLRDRLDLHPWTDRDRIRVLQEKYKKLLKLPPDVAAMFGTE